MVFLLLAVMLCMPCAFAQDGVGARPYEMVEANRTTDQFAPLVAFEELTGWTAVGDGATGAVVRTREQPLWDASVGKITYRKTGASGALRVLAPAPIPVPGGFDAVMLWVYGNNWSYAPDPSTPPVTVSALFQAADGKEFAVALGPVNWKEWHLLHKRVPAAQLPQAKAGAVFVGLLISNIGNTADRTLYVDNLIAIVEPFPPLTFAPRPKRGIAMFPGQSAGVNTGPGTLPFPNRERTICPENVTPGYTNEITPDGNGFVFTYRGADGTLTYRLDPRTGTWSDLTAAWAGGPAFRPCVGGGVYFPVVGGVVPPETAVHLGTTRQGDAVVSRWTLTGNNRPAQVTYTYRIWGKSLVIDTAAPAVINEVRFGAAQGLANPKLITNPYYALGTVRPAVVASGTAAQPLFVTGNVDWYLSNASTLYAENKLDGDSATYNGGTRYLFRTDGRRNDCYERFLLTVSPRYEETLITIPNPQSPWMAVTGTHLFRSHSAGDRKKDLDYWTTMKRYGISEVVIVDHESMWRDGGESFTFRTATAPRKGGDASAQAYARALQDQLGYRYGPYTNYVEIAPVNRFWSTDMALRLSDKNFQTDWPRTYVAKPARAVELSALQAPELQRKFNFSTGYCDVHTSIAPWEREDFDYRVPGAATQAGTFYAYGEIMLQQKAAWNGPVYSEGRRHYLYAGLTDGNYAQDLLYNISANPWLVDFDLRALHNLNVNVGMGQPKMFYNRDIPENISADADRLTDRFLAATAAFGHAGWLLRGDMVYTLRSYYMIQQLAARYTQAPVQEIRYVDAAGVLQDTSTAVMTGAYTRSQVVVRYANGCVVAANGSEAARLTTTVDGRAIDLPPGGYLGWTTDGAIEVRNDESTGHRADYAATPAYTFIDGRGTFTRFPRAAANGCVVSRALPDGSREVISYNATEFGFAGYATTARAYNQDGKDLGATPVRYARGLAYPQPVAGAFRYILPTGPAGPPAGALTSDRATAAPGETVTIRGRQTHAVQIPRTAAQGERLWFTFDNQWLDFTVAGTPVAAVDPQPNPQPQPQPNPQPNPQPVPDPAPVGQAMPTATAVVEGETLRIVLTGTGTAPGDAVVTVGGRSEMVRVTPGTVSTLLLPASLLPETPGEALTITMGGETQRFTLARISVPVATVTPLPARTGSAMRLRGRGEQAIVPRTGALVAAATLRCGGVARPGLLLQAPWKPAGTVSTTFSALTVPAEGTVLLRGQVGKRDGSPAGQVPCKIVVIPARGTPTAVWSRTLTARAWVPFQADLSPWRGQQIRIKLFADAGKDAAPRSDQSCWADLRVIATQPTVVRQLRPVE